MFTFASIPIDMDCNEAFWFQAEARLDDEDFQRIDLTRIELIFEVLVEQYYGELNRVLGEVGDRYKMIGYAGPNTAILELENE